MYIHSKLGVFIEGNVIEIIIRSTTDDNFKNIIFKQIVVDYNFKNVFFPAHELWKNSHLGLHQEES